MARSIPVPPLIAAKARAFDARMASAPTTFCCRRPEEAPRYGLPVVVPLNMTSEFRFSDTGAHQEC